MSVTKPIVVDLTSEQFKSYQAQALCRAGASDVHLLIAPNRNRLQPIVVEVETDLLVELLSHRDGEDSAKLKRLDAELERLQEHNERQYQVIRERDQTIEALQTDLLSQRGSINRQAERIEELEGALTAHGYDLTDAEQRYEQLQACHIERGEELAAVKGNYERQREEVTSLKQRCERLADAIRQVLYPSDANAAWKTVHTALRNGLAYRGFHARNNHPFWSLHYWFGCLCCVPDWLLYSAEDVSQDQTCVTRDAAVALGAETANILRPALTNQAVSPKPVSPAAALDAAGDPGVCGTPAVDASVSA